MADVANVAEGGGRFPALRNSSFRWYLSSSGLYMYADNVEHVIGYWLLWELTHSPFWLGYAVFSHWLPFTLLSFYTGALADRHDNRVLIQVGQAMYVFCSLSLGLMVLTGTLNVWVMAALLLVHGAAGAVAEPSAQVLIHSLVGRKDLMSALSLNASTRQSAQFVGPAIGGLLLLAVGPGVGLLINALLYLPFSLVLLFMRRAPNEKPAHAGQGWAAIKEGLDCVRREPLILGLTAVAAVPGLIMGQAYQAMMPAIATQFQVGSTGYSALLSATGLGAIAGGVALGSISGLRGRGMVMLATAAGWGILLAAFALSPSYLLSLVLLLGVGATNVAHRSLSQALVQAHSPDNLRGRIMGVYQTATQGSRMVSGLVVGALATLAGPSLALAAAAALLVVAVAAIAVSMPRLRTLD